MENIFNGKCEFQILKREKNGEEKEKKKIKPVKMRVFPRI